MAALPVSAYVAGHAEQQGVHRDDGLFPCLLGRGEHPGAQFLAAVQAAHGQVGAAEQPGAVDPVPMARSLLIWATRPVRASDRPTVTIFW